MHFRSKNLLITGGCGFIGSNFIEYILAKYPDVKIYNLDALTYAGNISNTKNFLENERYKFIHGNICDEMHVKEIFSEFEIDGVINFAAESHVDNSISRPDEFINTNINGLFNLINNAYKFWMQSPFRFKEKFQNSRFHQISTDEVYGSTDKNSFTEESNYCPNSPYSASKGAADLIVRSFNKTYGLNTTISISSNNFGVNQNKEKFIPKVLESMIKNKEIPLYGDGKNIRDWIDVNNHCEAIEIIFNNSKSGESYNVGGGNEITNLDLINLLFSILSKKSKCYKKIKFVKDRFGHDRRYSLNCKKIERDLGWQNKSDFKSDLSNYINKII